MSLRRLLLPEPHRHLPWSRGWSVMSRTLHIAAFGTLLGGHVFGVPADRLIPWLWATIASGAALTFTEVYPSLDWFTQVAGVTLLVKLAVLCVIPFAWDARVPILFLVVAIAGIGSHMPGRFRHRSLLTGRDTRSGA
jgi:hypothetical protein